MHYSDGQIPDIAANIKNIEKLKAKLLSDVSGVFDIMVSGSGHSGDMDEKLAEVIISTYVLAKKMGYEYSEIDAKALNKLKLIILSEDTPRTEYNELSNWIRAKDKRR